MKSKMYTTPHAGAVLPLGRVVHVGFTGHRNLGESPTENPGQSLSASISRILGDIQKITGGTPRQKLYTESPPVIRFISCLAEGSDRIAVRCAEEAGFPLLFCLPFGRDRYERDFSSTDSKAEYRDFLGRGEAVFEINLENTIPPRAYSYAGQTMVDHSDLLIAVWDGEDTGKAGGTSYVVEYARESGVPVIWIPAGGIGTIRILDDSGSREYSDVALENALRFKVPCLTGDSEGDETSLDDFWSEDGKKPEMMALGYRWLLRFFSPKGYKPSLGYVSPDSFFKSADNALYGTSFTELKPGIVDGVRRLICTQFGWADNLAIHYSDIYRTAAMSRPILVLGTVMALCCGFYWAALRAAFFLTYTSGDFLGNSLGFVFQLLFLLAIYRLEHRNKKMRWHQKFMNYRILAEMIRSIRYLFPMGFTSYGTKTPEYNLKTDSWIGKHIHTITRFLGLPDREINRDAVLNFLSEFKEFIKGQRQYHHNNFKRYNTASQSLDRLWHGLFWMGLVVVGFRAILSFGWHYDWIFSWLNHYPWLKHYKFNKDLVRIYANMSALFVPALGTFVYALLGSLGWEKLRDRSAVMQEKLETMEGRFEQLIDETKGERIPFERIKDCAFQTCLFIQEEVADWRGFVATKSISRM